VHHGALVIAGHVATSARFRHADGRDYGDVSNPHALDVYARVFAGLRGLGFRESQVRAALSELARGDGATLTAETLLRESLLRLTADRAQS
jgi:Holliday junction resolvasome RuvABC DNA-binding subunit